VKDCIHLETYITSCMATTGNALKIGQGSGDSSSSRGGGGAVKLLGCNGAG